MLDAIALALSFVGLVLFLVSLAGYFGDDKCD